MTSLLSNAEIPQQIGPYRIEAEVAQTRTLLICRAHDTLYDRPVLLKVLVPAIAQRGEVVRHFISLGRDAARLHHPHLLEVYEAGHADGVNYIAQEVAGGPSLAARLHNRQHPYLIYDAITIIEQLASALDYVHQQGYVHGALTADSIQFTANNEPKISDVGLLPLETLGESGTYVANVSPYMAPEQARGESGMERQADIYTLGVIAFQLLTGRAPFSATNPLALLRKIIDEEPPVDDLAVGAIPAHVGKTLQRALAKNAVDRHTTATELADALLRGETPPPLSAASKTTDNVRQAPEAEHGQTATSRQGDDNIAVIELGAEDAVWSTTTLPPRFVPYEATTATVADGQAVAAQAVPKRPRSPAFVLSILGTVAILLTLVTTGRVIWSLFGEQMIDAAMTPYAAAQASRLTPPQPPTMLTSADTPGFGESSGVTNEDANTRTLLATDPPLIVAMSGVAGRGGVDTIANLTGSPAMVIIAPSRTPTKVSTDTPSPTNTPIPSNTPTATDTPTATATPIPTDTATPAPTATATATSSPTATGTATPTATSSATATATIEPTATPSPTPSATATVTPTPTATVVPLASELGGRIAYTRWDPRSDRYSLIFYSIAKDESWPIVPNRRQPDFAPNGQLVASGDGGYIDNLVLMGTNGENPVPISAHSEDAHAHWAPTGKAMVFDSTLVGDGRHRLYLQNDESYGEQHTPMMFEAWELFGRYPIFLSNGQIVYNGCDVWENAVHCGLYQVDTQGSRPQAVTQWPGDIPTDNLGNQILVTSDRDGDWNVYRVDASSGAAQQLTESPGRDGLATASPDGNYIAFVSEREGKWAVYVMDANGENEQKLFDLDGGFGNGDRDWLQERISWGR